MLDLNAGLTQVLASNTTTSGYPSTHTYLYGNGRIGEIRSGEFVYHQGDALGSVRQLTDGSAAVIRAQSYQPFGSELNTSGTATSIFGFAGEARDATDLIFLRARFYNPSLGRFFQQDAWPGEDLRPQSLNPYGYVGNNVINLTDPTGQCYPPLDWLRSIEPEQCKTMDQAAFIWGAPSSMASPTDKAMAGAWIASWATLHAVPIVAAGLTLASAAAWAYGFAVAHPVAAGIAGGVASLADDAATVTAALLGDRQAQQDAMVAYQLGAMDGPVPLMDALGGAGFFAKRGIQICNEAIDEAVEFADEVVEIADDIAWFANNPEIVARLGNEAGGGGGIDEGIAIVRGYKPLAGNELPHFTVEVKYGDKVLSTDQVITSRFDLSQTTIRRLSYNRSPDMPPIEVSLPNADNAIKFQESVIEAELGPYGFRNNCVTHVCDVLRAGGAGGVPRPGKGVFDLQYMIDSGFGDLFSDRLKSIAGR